MVPQNRGTLLAKTGLGTPWSELGYPQGQDRIGVHHLQAGYAWTGYAGDGMPVVVSRRRTVLFALHLSSYFSDIILSVPEPLNIS